MLSRVLRTLYYTSFIHVSNTMRYVLLLNFTDVVIYFKTLSKQSKITQLLGLQLTRVSPSCLIVQ